MECERLIMGNIKKLITEGYSKTVIEAYLIQLLKYFEEKISVNEGIAECTKYRFIESFIKNIIATPYWGSSINKMPYKS